MLLDVGILEKNVTETRSVTPNNGVQRSPTIMGSLQWLSGSKQLSPRCKFLRSLQFSTRSSGPSMPYTFFTRSLS
jgi:hypothetical protein